MDLIRQEDAAAVVGLAGTAGVQAGDAAAEVQPQLRVGVGVGDGVLAEPVQHLLGGEGAGREAEDPGELLLQLRPLRLRTLQVSHQVPEGGVQDGMESIRRFRDSCYLTIFLVAKG